MCNFREGEVGFCMIHSFLKTPALGVRGRHCLVFYGVAFYSVSMLSRSVLPRPETVSPPVTYTEEAS